MGLALSLAAALSIVANQLLLALILLLFAGLLDVVDGELARRRAQASAGGAFLDSNLDRLSEAAVYTGLIVLWLESAPHWWIGLALAALIGSLMVSYARARAEALGFDATGGWGQRPERLIIFYLALASGAAGYADIMAILIGVIALLAAGTFLTRFSLVRYQARQRGADEVTPQP
jgi:CDP-diacylglycerol--glycerol-3-phosphate 3-phosphatidyltransferase